MPDTPSAPRRVQVGQAVCDFDQLTLQVGDETIRLEPRLAGVLAVLIQRAGETLSRDELLSLAWDADASDEALTQAISRLRKLLKDRQAIETVPRVGYRLSATVTAVPKTMPPEATTAVRPPAASANPGRFLNASRKRWLEGGAMLIAAATLGALLALWLFSGNQPIGQEFEIQPAEDGEIEFVPQDEAKP